MIVYKITNNINGKVYIGQTRRNLQQRMRQHFQHAKDSAISNAIRKYGKDAFKVEVLEEVFSLEELCYLEQYYIKHCDSMSPNGYNLICVGPSSIYSPETRLKMSDSAKKALSNENLRARISAIRKGKKTHNSTPIQCVQNGLSYGSLCDAAKALNISQSSLSMFFLGKRRAVKGLTFKKLQKIGN